MRKKVVTTLIWIAVIIGIMLVARILVNNFDLIELSRKLHGY